MTLALHEKPHLGKTLAIEKASPASSLDLLRATVSTKQAPTDGERNGYMELPQALSKLLKTLFIVLLNRTNQLISATAVALTILCYRYVQWTQLAAIRDGCQATLASVEPISPDSGCVKVLLGPRLPPPYHLYVKDDGYTEGFEDMLREFLLANEDRRFLPLWQFLLLGDRLSPDTTMVLFATVMLPLRIAILMLPTLDARCSRQTGFSYLRDISTWLFWYYTIGLTGIWFQFGEILCGLLQWTYGGRGLAAIPPTLVPGIDIYEILITFIGWVLAFTPIHMSKPEDAKHNSPLFDQEGTERPNNNTEVLGSTTITKGGSKSPRATNKLVFGWRILDLARLVPVTLISGWRVIPVTLVNMFIRFYLVDQMRKILERRTPKGLCRVLYLLVWLMTVEHLNDMDVQLLDRGRLSHGASDFLWTQYFYRKDVERKYRSNFSLLVDKVIRGEETEVTFNSTELHQIYQHPFIGNHIFPEPWNRIRVFLGETGHGGDEDYSWMRTEL